MTNTISNIWKDLSAAARVAYVETDPITITCSDGLYSIKGCVEREGMTLQDLDDLLCSLIEEDL